MSQEIFAIEAVRADGLRPDSASIAKPAAGFGNWVAAEIQALNQQLLTSEAGVRSLAAGTATNLHDVMLQLEQSRLTLQLAMQVRGRVVEAYQEVMRMQV